MKLTIVGSGYVGLVAGTCFADSGNDVICVDVDAAKIRTLNAGKIPIYEPGLEELVHKNVREKRLSFSTDLANAVGQSEVVFIAVGTPEGENGDADLKYVLNAAEQVGKALKRYTIIVDKSTVPVGTADRVRETVAKVTDQPFDVVSNPEFLKEGAAIDDFLKPDRVVIGTNSEHARRIMAELYQPFVRTENPIIVMDPASAEMAKYAANAILATRISFINEIANLCEAWGADVEQVRRGIGADVRIGRSFLFPGLGFGGSCFPKDLAALQAMGQQRGVPTEVISAVQSVNRRQRQVLLAKVMKHFGGSLKGLSIAVWGLAFKPCTDDMRESAALTIIEGLLDAGAKIRAYDPVAGQHAREIFGNRIELCEIDYDCLTGADALVVVTEWNEFRQPDLEKMRTLMRQPVIFDGRNIYDPERLGRLGFTYYAMGRPSPRSRRAT